MAFLALSFLLASAPDTPLDHAVAAQMEKWHSPGAAVAVVKDGRVVLARGYGLADRERSLPVTADTPFHLGSVGKVFTASAVLMLIQDGRIDLDKRVVDYLPRMPAAYGSVTPRHLLTHTSGIKRDFGAGERSLVGHELYAAMAEAAPQFRPGERLAYSNTDYILLGILVEAVGGQTLGTFLEARIFGPLGMASTRYVAPNQRVAGMAVGYEWHEGEFQAVGVIPGRFGAGSVVSTASDLARWDAALYTDEPLRKSTLDRMWRATTLSGGKPAILGFDDVGRLLESGMGWFTSPHLGHRVVHHGGNIDGYSAQLDRFVDDRITVVVLANNEAHAAINIASVAKGDTTPSTAYTVARCHARLGQRERPWPRWSRPRPWATATPTASKAIPPSRRSTPTRAGLESSPWSPRTTVRLLPLALVLERVAGQPVGQQDRDRGGQDHEHRDHVRDRPLPRPRELREDPDWQGLLLASRERRDDDLVE